MAIDRAKGEQDPSALSRARELTEHLVVIAKAEALEKLDENQAAEAMVARYLESWANQLLRSPTGHERGRWFSRST